MIDRIIIIVEASFTLRDYNRFGIEDLRANNFKVEIWDITAALHPEIYASYTPPDKIGDRGLVTFNDKEELYSKLSALTNSDFAITAISYRSKTLGTYRAISRSRAYYAVMMIDSLPSAVGGGQKSVFRALGKLFPITGERIFAKIVAETHFSFFGVKPARLIFAGGEKYRASYYPIYPKTEVLWCHALDYDLYLKEREVAPAARNKIAVFLDEYLPFHPDWQYYGLKFPMDPALYYSLLDKLFGKVENELGMEVVIAAHPRSNYDEKNDHFGSRRCVRGRTCSLVRDSSLVISHASTSINFANLFHKPVLFVTSEDLDRCFEGPIIRSIAHWFGKKPVFIDKDISIDWQREMVVARERYDDYRRAYVKKDGSAEMNFWQITADRLKKI